MYEGELYIEHYLHVEDIAFLVYISLALSAAILLYSLWIEYRRWTYGGQRIPLAYVWRGLINFVKYGLLQRKVVYRKYGGLMHLFIFAGFAILAVGTTLRFIECDFTLPLLNVRLLAGQPYLLYKLLMNVGGLLALIGVLMALLRRLFFKPKNLPNTLGDYGVLLLLLTILVTGFILDGIVTASYRKDWIGIYDPVGSLLSPYLEGLPNLTEVYRIVWLVHMILGIFSIAFMLLTKLNHVLTGGLFNTLFGRLDHPSAFKPIPNIEEIVEKGGVPGVGRVADFSWKQRMDFSSCVKCARCVDECPAFNSGKPLSPMDLMLKLRKLMSLRAFDEELVPKHLESTTVWSCVTCGSCTYNCPLLIHHVETILDLRRYLFGKSESVPAECLQSSYNVMRYGNPMGYSPTEREKFVSELIEELGVEVASPDKEYEYIYWIGCNSAYDPAARTIAKSLVKILKECNVSFAVLPDEGCCGEPIRRIGDELLFKEAVNKNRELLSNYRFKKLLVNCPHGFNVFKHEYPLYGVKVEVVHHAQLLYELIKAGKLKVRKLNGYKVTYHDPCYLGRWNGVFEEPRFVVKSVAGEFVELKRSRANSFCCGGGGGQLYYDIKVGERISKVRMDEVLSSGASAVITACPYCKIMLSAEAKDLIKVMDICELLTA